MPFPVVMSEGVKISKFAIILLIFLAHSAVLSSSCAAMKSIIMSTPRPTKLMLNEFTMETVQRMITFLYTGKLSIPEQHGAALDLDKLIDKYELKDSLPDSIVQRFAELQQNDTTCSVPYGLICPLPPVVIRTPTGVIQVQKVTNIDTNNTLNNLGNQHDVESIKKGSGYDKNSLYIPVTTASKPIANRLVNCPMPSGVIQVPNEVIQTEQVIHTNNFSDKSVGQQNVESIKKELGCDNNLKPMPSGVIQVHNEVIQTEQVTPRDSKDTSDKSGNQQNVDPIKKESEYDENNLDASRQMTSAPEPIANSLDCLVKKEIIGDLENQVEKNEDVEDAGAVIEIQDKTRAQAQYFCTLCFHHSTTKGAITCHLRSRHNVINCKTCEGGLVKFVCNEGSRKQVVFQCSKCHNCHKTRKGLQKHMKVHRKHLQYIKQLLNQDNLTCIPCNKLFPNETALNIHLRAHSKGFIPEIGKYQCQMCDKMLNPSSIKVGIVTIVINACTFHVDHINS